MDFSKRQCPECGKKEFRKKNIIDNFEAAWKDHKAVPIIVNLELYSCTCGNYAASPKDVRRIDEAAEQSIRLWSAIFLEEILAVSKFTQKKLADHLGISSVYLTELKKMEKTPKFQLWNTLKLVALDPDATLKKLNPSYKILRNKFGKAS